MCDFLDSKLACYCAPVVGISYYRLSVPSYGKSPTIKKHAYKKLQPALGVTFLLFSCKSTGHIRNCASLTHQHWVSGFRGLAVNSPWRQALYFSNLHLVPNFLAGSTSRGQRIIKVGTDVRAWALVFSGFSFSLGFRFWEVNFARALGFWQFLTKKCNIW